MVPTYEQMGDWLEEIAQEFPEAFFEELDGGIQLEEQELPDPDFPPGEMYIMGEYCHDMLGRYIVLYYGSFRRVLSLPEDVETDKITATHKDGVLSIEIPRKEPEKPAARKIEVVKGE